MLILCLAWKIRKKGLVTKHDNKCTLNVGTSPYYGTHKNL